MGHRVSSPDLVGRREELDLLDATLAAVCDGRATTVLIGGDAGIGKSRLVEELRARALARGARGATGTCVPGDGGLAFGPVVGLLRDLVRQVDDPTSVAVLDPVLHRLGLGAPSSGTGTPADTDGPPTSDGMAKTRLFGAVLAALSALAEPAPLVLVFEDLQWADSASAELLAFLTRNLGDNRVLVVGTYRSEEVGRDHQLRPWLQELLRQARTVQIRLGGLDIEDLAGMIEGVLGHQPDWALVEAVWARSQGNPFFAEELTAARHQRALPPELHGVIMARVEGLAEETRRVLQVIATAGTHMDHDLLAAASDDDEMLDRALHQAIDGQILVVDGAQGSYHFRHALLGEAVYTSLLPGEQRRLHRRLASVLAADPSLGPPGAGHRAAELARHWSAAGQWDEALTTSLAAAEAARSLWAFPEALAHIEHALTAWDRVAAAGRDPGVDRLALLVDGAEIAYLSGPATRAVELAREAAALGDARGDPMIAARCLILLGRNAWGIGQPDVAFDAYQRASALLPADPPSWERAAVLAEEARGLMLLSRFREAEDRCVEAIAAARAVESRALEGHALNTLGTCRGYLGDGDEGIRLLRQSLDIARELGEPTNLDRAYTNLSDMLLTTGRLEEAAAIVHESLAAISQVAIVTMHGAASNSAHAMIRLGRYAEADAILAQLGAQGIGICANSPELVPAPMAIRRGRFAEAAELLATADRRTASLADVQTRGLYHIDEAELALEEERPDDAYEHVERARALIAATDDEPFHAEICALGTRALADRLAQAKADGRRVDVDKLRILARELTQVPEELTARQMTRGRRATPRVWAIGATCAAEESRLHVSDPTRWSEAAARWDQAGEPFPAAYCRFREGEAILGAGGDRRRATDVLRGAAATAGELGAAPLLGRISDLARRARITLPGVEDTGSTLASDAGLTPREVEVLGHLAAGRTDREIADALFISKKTASVHVSNLLRKLDAANRVEAGRIGRAHQLG